MHSQGWPLDSNDRRRLVRLSLRRRTWSPSASSCTSTTRTRTCRRTTSSSASRRIRRSATRSRAASGSRYGARAINEGGLQSVPKLAFPGGALIGCAAGFVNLPRIKGSHNAMKTGMLGAEAAFAALGAGRAHDELADVRRRLAQVVGVRGPVQGAQREARPQVGHVGSGSLHGGVHMWLNDLGLGALVPWTLRHTKPDNASLLARGGDAADRLSEVRRRAHVRQAVVGVPVEHEPRGETSRSHLQLRDAVDPGARSISRIYDGPEARYCPAGVYEFVDDEAAGGKRLQINAQNCVHCKTCDIKDPLQNIHWVTPEGGGGPNYPGM